MMRSASTTRHETPYRSYSYTIFFFPSPAPTEISTLSLHDALPISTSDTRQHETGRNREQRATWRYVPARAEHPSFEMALDRKSTRLNSSHITISYAVFCLKKKNSREIIIHLSAFRTWPLDVTRRHL